MARRSTLGSGTAYGHETHGGTCHSSNSNAWRTSMANTSSFAQKRSKSVAATFPTFAETSAAWISFHLGDPLPWPGTTSSEVRALDVRFVRCAPPSPPRNARGVARTRDRALEEGDRVTVSSRPRVGLVARGAAKAPSAACADMRVRGPREQVAKTRRARCAECGVVLRDDGRVDAGNVETSPSWHHIGAPDENGHADNRPSSESTRFGAGTTA